MIVDGKDLKTLAVFQSMVTLPDCWVARPNKLGHGNGEAKLYISSKELMRDFFGAMGFHVNCFLLKKDLLAYMTAVKSEYDNPSQPYADGKNLSKLWNERVAKINALPDVVSFGVKEQSQIVGPRGYVKSSDAAYELLRELALPLVSYLYIEKLKVGERQIFYWRLFVDFEAINEKKNGPLVFRYGLGKATKARGKGLKSQLAAARARRDGQAEYRAKLLEQCVYCPFTKIADERLLIASHIKPWSISKKEEQIDPYNGYILSPLYDRLFDQGFMTFTDSRHVILSNMISPDTWKKINLKQNQFIQALPMDEKRKFYLDFHRKNVFKGSLA